jgi:hypothetical protein
MIPCSHFWRGNPIYGDDTLLTSLKNTIPTLHAEAFTMKGEDDTLLAFLPCSHFWRGNPTYEDDTLLTSLSTNHKS